MAATPCYHLAILLLLSLSSHLHSVSGDHSVGEQIPIDNDDLSRDDCSVAGNKLECEVEQMKLKVAQLELLLDVISQELHTKSLHIESCEEKIEEMNKRIDQLQLILSNLKGTPNNEDMITAIEAEVQALEAAVRKNDGLLKQLRHETRDKEHNAIMLASRVETMVFRVPELWLHVQKLEQAAEVIERRTAEFRKHTRNQRCPYFKLTNKLLICKHQNVVPAFLSEAMNLLRRSFSSLKKYHHQLQGFIKQEMERHEISAGLVNEEWIFFLASAIIVFPLMLGLKCLSSQG